MGSHRVGHDWGDLAAAAARFLPFHFHTLFCLLLFSLIRNHSPACSFSDSAFRDHVSFFLTHQSVSELWVLLFVHHPLDQIFFSKEKKTVYLINFFHLLYLNLDVRKFTVMSQVSNFTCSVYIILLWGTFIKIKLLLYLFVSWLPAVWDHNLLFCSWI